MIDYILFFDLFLFKKEQNVGLQTNFQGKLLIPFGIHEKSSKQREPMVRLRRTLNSKRYRAEVLQNLQRFSPKYSQRYPSVSLKSVESYIFFGILHIFWNPKKESDQESQLPTLESYFFFGWNPMESDAFYLWNPMESRRFFLESQGIYTSLVKHMGCTSSLLTSFQR